MIFFACYMSIATMSKEKEDMGLRYRENEGERVPRGYVGTLGRKKGMGE